MSQQYQNLSSDELYLEMRRAGVMELEGKTTKRAIAAELAARREMLAAKRPSEEEQIKAKPRKTA